MRRLLVAFVAVGFGVSVWAQQAPPPVTQNPATATIASQTPQPQFRSSIELVRLDVSVLDKNRRPLRGLSASDFTVLENGQEQSIAAFTPVELPDVVADASAAPWLRNVASDVGGNSDMQQRRLFILAIDDATIQNDVNAIKNVKDIARKVVDRLGPTDLMSVVFTRDNRGSQDFTSDRARLLRAIDTFTVGFRDMGGSDRTAGGAGDDLWFMYSVGVLERAVDFLSDVPDRRKAIIYVGQGLPFDLEVAVGPVSTARVGDAAAAAAQTAALSNQQNQARIKDQMTDVFERANRANVNIYTVDACGLRVPPPPPAALANMKMPPTCLAGVEIDYLTQLAAATGGRPVLNTNDFTPGLDGVFAENSSYYLLGFQSTNQARDGKFRQLEVRVNKPGLEVRTRTGYDAPREESATRPRPAASPLGKALNGVVPRGDFPLQITASPFRLGEGKNSKDKNALPSTVAVVVGFKQPIQESVERMVENVDMQISAWDVDGRSYGNTRRRADVTIRAGATGMAEYEVLGRIDLKPGRYQLRVAAVLASSDTAGSVYFDVDVPDFAQLPLSMSGLLVSSTPTPFFAPKDGLIDIAPVIPTTRRVFNNTFKLSAFARVYQGTKAKLVDVPVRVTVRDSEDKVLLDQPQVLAAGKFAARAADLQLDVPIAGLATGNYLLTVEVGTGPTAVRRDSRFRISK